MSDQQDPIPDSDEDGFDEHGFDDDGFMVPVWIKYPNKPPPLVWGTGDGSEGEDYHTAFLAWWKQLPEGKRFAWQDKYDVPRHTMKIVHDRIAEFDQKLRAMERLNGLWPDDKDQPPHDRP